MPDPVCQSNELQISARVRWPVDLCLSHPKNLTNFSSENECLALSHYGHQNFISLKKLALSKNYRWIPLLALVLIFLQNNSWPRYLYSCPKLPALEVASANKTFSSIPHFNCIFASLAVCVTIASPFPQTFNLFSLLTTQLIFSHLCIKPQNCTLFTWISFLTGLNFVHRIPLLYKWLSPC